MKKIVLAFSGGLDTSFCVPYLIDKGFNSLLKDAIELMKNETENERKTN